MPSTQDPQLIETAVKFSEPSESVRIACGAASDPIVVTIDSHGKTIPIDQIPKFFDLFSISEVSTPGGDLGLGPPVAFRILALFDGAVTVANRDSSGIRLTISLKSSNLQAPRPAESPSITVRFSAESLAKGDQARLNELVSTGVMWSTAAGIVTMAGSFFLAPQLGRLFHVGQPAFVTLVRSCCKGAAQRS
jgi:hypothetical protein